MTMSKNLFVTTPPMTSHLVRFGLKYPEKENSRVQRAPEKMIYATPTPVTDKQAELLDEMIEEASDPGSPYHMPVQRYDAHEDAAVAAGIIEEPLTSSGPSGTYEDTDARLPGFAGMPAVTGPLPPNAAQVGTEMGGTGRALRGERGAGVGADAGPSTAGLSEAGTDGPGAANRAPDGDHADTEPSAPEPVAGTSSGEDPTAAEPAGPVIPDANRSEAAEAAQDAALHRTRSGEDDGLSNLTVQDLRDVAKAQTPLVAYAGLNKADLLAALRGVGAKATDADEA